ncbi:EamA-like transporter family protein [Ancylobacter aquaticus]|uniref:EamA-like transporter family protein n=1 Tax=Ancylobacter aquaticus TaxID=100 RepID=A0A4V2PK79_ANCAQ|nr:DMT family transporter [Ancylobacter aquaticus]TCK31366.1 EamA-like transporter family protein [Ancylobacter aquaticus]
MDIVVLLVVLLSALLQAGWNVLLKLRLDPLAALTLVVLGGGAVALPVALWLGPPTPALLPWMAGSMSAHMAFYACLVGAYARADLGLVYPVARGGALLMTAGIAIAVLHEPVRPIGIAGIALLSASVLVTGWRSRKEASQTAALMLALGSGVAVTAYSLIDGTAGRMGSPGIYTAWLFVGDAVLVAVGLSLWKGAAFLRPLRPHWRLALVGGAMLFVSYWLCVWAMTRAPISLVAAVREASVLFGAALAVLVLRETLRPERLIAALLVVAGVTLIKLH